MHILNKTINYYFVKHKILPIILSNKLLFYLDVLNSSCYHYHYVLICLSFSKFSLNQILWRSFHLNLINLKMKLIENSFLVVKININKIKKNLSQISNDLYYSLFLHISIISLFYHKTNLKLLYLIYSYKINKLSLFFFSSSIYFIIHSKNYHLFDR